MNKPCQSSSPAKPIRCLSTVIPYMPYLGELILSPKQMHRSHLRSGTASRLQSPLLTQALGNTAQAWTKYGLLLVERPPLHHCFQGELPDALVFTVLPSIYSIWVLCGPDNATLHDLRVTSRTLYPEKTRGNNSFCSSSQEITSFILLPYGRISYSSVQPAAG